MFIFSFGHPPAISNLLTVPPYIFASTYTRYLFVAILYPFSLPLAILLFVWAWLSDKYKIRSPFIYCGLIMMLIGFSINISDAAPGVKYFGTFFVVAGAYASFPGVVAW